MLYNVYQGISATVYGNYITYTIIIYSITMVTVIYMTMPKVTVNYTTMGHRNLHNYGNLIMPKVTVIYITIGKQ